MPRRAINGLRSIASRPGFGAPAATGGPVPCPPLDLEEFSELVRSLSAEELELAAPPFEALPSGETPEEVCRQTMEALWQNLLFDPQA